MKEKKKDEEIVKEAIGDPAFYNDQIGLNKEPQKANMERGKGDKCKRGL